MRMWSSESRAPPTVAHHALLAYKPSLIATLPIRPSAERIMRFLVHAWRIDSHRAALESMRAERTGFHYRRPICLGFGSTHCNSRGLHRDHPHAKREIISPNVRAPGSSWPKTWSVAIRAEAKKAS